MCAPIALGIASAVGSAATFIGDSSAASQANKTAKEVSLRNSELARASAVNEYSQLNQRQIEEQIKAFQEIEQITNETRNAIGATTSSAAAVNIKGQSVEDLLNNFRMNEFNNITTVNQNLDFIRQNIASDKEGTKIGLSSRLLASVPDYVRPPNAFGSFINAGTNAFSAYINAGGLKKDRPDPAPNQGVTNASTQGASYAS